MVAKLRNLTPDDFAEEAKKPTPEPKEQELTDVPKRRGRPPGSGNKPPASGNPLEEKVSKSELQNKLAMIVNGLALFIRSETRFEAGDFDNVASGLIDVINLFPPARVVLRVLGPFSVLGDILNKARLLSEGRQKDSAKR